MTRPGFALLLLIAVYTALLFSDFAMARVKEFRGNAAWSSPSDFERLHSTRVSEGAQHNHGAR